MTMLRFSQVGIALGALGAVLTLMGLFPGVTGAATTAGIGLVQVIMVLAGYGLLILGALIYLKCAFYLNVPSNLAQQIGIRLALTGLLFAAFSGLADIFGFGSHIRDDVIDIFFGSLQMIGIMASFCLSSFGVLVYALSGARQAETSPVEQLSNRRVHDEDTTELALGNLGDPP